MAQNAPYASAVESSLSLVKRASALLVWMAWRWPSLLVMSRIVQPDTILRWHRAGFRAYWRWKSRGQPGRPKIDRELRELIRRMSKENQLWGARGRHRKAGGLSYATMQMPSGICAESSHYTRPTTTKLARTWDWARMRRYAGACNAPERLPPHQSYLGYTIVTRGSDFRERQGLKGNAAISQDRPKNEFAIPVLNAYLLSMVSRTRPADDGRSKTA
jgi:hypothetical protein